MLTETDLELVDAVQVNPRASWATIGATLGTPAVTVARRWKALSAAGEAWTSSTMGVELSRGAVLEIACRPGTVEAVVAILCEKPDVLTVGRTVGGFDIYVLTVSASVESLTRSLLGTFADLDVAVMRSHVYFRLYGGSHWRLSVLNRTQTDQLRENQQRPQRRSPVAPEDRRLFLALAHDARRSYADLAEELGTAPHTVRRQLERMRRQGYIGFRADMARPLAGWKLTALLWLVVPDDEVDLVGRGLGAWTETRFCAAIASPANIALVVSLRTVEQLEELTLRMRSTYPSATVADRRLVLRLVKVHGRILDESGRSERVVPLDPWAVEADN